MKKLAFALVALASPNLAHAGRTCGGGGSGGNNSSSSSSSSPSQSNGTSWSYSGHTETSAAASQAPVGGCIDDTDVHGYRHCTKFGSWSGNLGLPPIFVELGSNMRQFTSGLPQQQGQVTHGLESFAYRVVMPQSSNASIDTAATTMLRLGFIPSHGLYTALEGELGGLTSAASASTEMTSTGTFGGPRVVQQGALVLGAYGVAGVRGSIGRATLAVEGAGGVRSTRYHFDSTYHACESTSTIAVNQGVVEARARAEVWMGPWFTLGATAGANLLARGDWLAGLYVGFHSRAYAGTR
jgi:hypothetical protein